MSKWYSLQKPENDIYQIILLNLVSNPCKFLIPIQSYTVFIDTLKRLRSKLKSRQTNTGWLIKINLRHLLLQTETHLCDTPSIYKQYVWRSIKVCGGKYPILPLILERYSHYNQLLMKNIRILMLQPLNILGEGRVLGLVQIYFSDFFSFVDFSLFCSIFFCQILD